MTDQEMRDRIKEINKQRDSLSDEKNKYEDYLREKKLLGIANSHMEFVGKYFKSKGLIGNRNDKVKGFKIISLNTKSIKEATCLVFTENKNNTQYVEKGIQIMNLRLWDYNELLLMPSDDSKKVIDFYEECSKDTFLELYNSYLELFMQFI